MCNNDSICHGKKYFSKGGVTMKEYTAPIIVEEDEMLFTKEVWEDFSEGNWCFGCTNCNCN